jgi:hypothetical protein
MIFTQPVWLVLSFVVAILILTEMKSHFITLSKKASEEEFITLAKFIAFAGIITLDPEKEHFRTYTCFSVLFFAGHLVFRNIIRLFNLKLFRFPRPGLTLTCFLADYTAVRQQPDLARKADRAPRQRNGFGYYAGQRHDVPPDFGPGTDIQSDNC